MLEPTPTSCLPQARALGASPRWASARADDYRPVTVRDLLRTEEYERLRPELRPKMLEYKRQRRVLVGDYLNLSFEDRHTVQYQLQEMQRAEGAWSHQRLVRELDEYNALLSGALARGCTMFIELPQHAPCTLNSGTIRHLHEHLYLRLRDGRRVRPQRVCQTGPSDLGLVRFLRFPSCEAPPCAVGVDHPVMRSEAPLELTLETALSSTSSRGTGPDTTDALETLFTRVDD